MLLNDELLLQITILAEICIKKCITFIEKLQKSLRAGGSVVRSYPASCLCKYGLPCTNGIFTTELGWQLRH